MHLVKGGGVPGEIRTHDPQIRNLVLYPAELRGLARTVPRATRIIKHDNAPVAGHRPSGLVDVMRDEIVLYDCGDRLL